MTKANGAKSGILGNLAKNAAAKAAPAKAVPAPVTPPVEAPAAPATPAVTAFDWSTVAAPTVAVYARNTPVRKNLEESTPQFIKDCVTGGFTTTSKNLDNKGRPVPTWMTLKLDTPERAGEFLKLAKRYATFKDFTLRGEANPAHVYVKNPEGDEPEQVAGAGYVRFCVKTREVRKPVAK